MSVTVERRNVFARSNLLTMRGGVIESKRPPHRSPTLSPPVLCSLTHPPHTVLGVDLVSSCCFLESPLLSCLSHLGPHRG